MLRGLIPGWSTSSQDKAEDKEPHRTAAPPEIALVTEEEEGDSTPKAESAIGSSNVPTFTLDSQMEDEDEEDEVEPAVPSFPAINSAQRASQMAPSPRPAMSASSTGLMPPPSRPGSTLKSSPAASLRIPTTGPLPNRGSPVNSQQRVSGGLSPNATVKTSNARGKVLLSPGHSPMDWAALTRTGNLAGVDSFKRVTPSELKRMTGRKGKPAWSSWQGKVYNITPYLPFHPGGEAELMKAAGRDGTKLFNEVHAWVNWENMLGSCLVGILVPEDFGKSALEEMD